MGFNLPKLTEKCTRIIQICEPLNLIPNLNKHFDSKLSIIYLKLLCELHSKAQCIHLWNFNNISQSYVLIYSILNIVKVKPSFSTYTTSNCWIWDTIQVKQLRLYGNFRKNATGHFLTVWAEIVKRKKTRE